LFTLSASSCGLKVSCSAVAKSRKGSGQIGWVVNLDGCSVVVVSVVNGSFVVLAEDVDVVVVFVVVLVDVVFFSVVGFFTGSSSILKKSRSSRKGREFSVVVVGVEALVVVVVVVVVVVCLDGESFEVVEFINWSIANHVNSWFLSGGGDGFSEMISYSSGLIDMDSNDTTEPLPSIIEGCLIGSCISKLSIKILLSLALCSTVLLF